MIYGEISSCIYKKQDLVNIVRFNFLYIYFVFVSSWNKVNVL